MTRTILSWDLVNWWLTRFIVHPPWFRLNSFGSCPEQVSIFYRPSTVQEKSQTKVVAWWHGQTCPETRPTDGSWILFWIYHGLAWARSTLVLNKCQYFTGSQQFRKNIKPRLLAMTRTILSQDSANEWQHAFCCEFASISTIADHYLSQSLIVAWLIFGSSSTLNLSLATGPVLSRDLFYAWASPEYRDSLTSAGLRLRRLSKIDIRLAFFHGM